MLKTETIAAISTATAPAGIGIVRITGEDAVNIADQVFYAKNHKKLKDMKSHTVHYGWIKDHDQVIDEVLAVLMKGPHSYTGEDTVEINCHGGILVMKKILETVIHAGARAAEPGEFTKQAFLNGRIDLSQAEAVIDIINSKNNYALKSSVSQLSGSISSQITELRKDILFEIAFIESALDDPEHISLDDYSVSLGKKINGMKEKLEKLLKTADRGRVISEGINTVIVGKPNVGKSSIMNVLLGEDRAIVTDIAGTTRDTLEEHIYLGGVSLNIIDTAGIHDTEDKVEKIGIKKALYSVAQADLVIFVIDSSIDFNQQDQSVLEMIDGQKTLILLNKIDLNSKIKKDWLEAKTGLKVIEFSAKTEYGLEDLEEEIKSLFYQGEIDFNDQVYITNVRHKDLLEKAYASLQMVSNSIDEGISEDFYSIDLMDAYEVLGSIIGESVGEDLVNEIFSKFCMGK